MTNLLFKSIFIETFWHIIHNIMKIDTIKIHTFVLTAVLYITFVYIVYIT